MLHTISVTLDSAVDLPKNAGTIEVDWSAMPQVSLDHMASVYLPQCFTDRVGGADKTADERRAQALKKLDSLMAGQIRTRNGKTGEPADPIAKAAFQAAKAALIGQLAKTPEAKEANKLDEFKGKGNSDAKWLWVLNERVATRGEAPFETLAQRVNEVLAANPSFMEAAIQAAEQAEAAQAAIAV